MIEITLEIADPEEGVDLEIDAKEGGSIPDLVPASSAQIKVK